MFPVRIVVSATLLSFVYGVSSRTDAMAQACHDPSILAAATANNDNLTAATSIQFDGAIISDGSYVATQIRLGVQRGRWTLETAIPVYSLQRTQRPTTQGFGDVSATVSATLIHTSSVGLRAFVTGTAPTGDDRASLGMGHWMVMPSVQAESNAGRFRGALALGVGAALFSDGHVHRPGGPLVNPMSQREATAMLRIAFQASLQLAPEVVAMAATPLDSSGKTRMTQGVGATWRIGDSETARAWQLRTLVQLGLLGNPYISRFTVDVGVSF
jgi:hypothetical protein